LAFDAAGEATAMSTSAAPSPQPERAEPRHPDPGLGTLTAKDYGAVFVRAGKQALDDHLTNLAAALAYYGFLAIPALLLVAVGAFGLFAGPDAVTSIVDRLSGVVPRETVDLVQGALLRVTEQQAGAGVTMALVGLVLALWTLTGAMQTLMWALNEAYDREETRGFLKRRLTGLAMVLLLVLAFALAFGLLVLGPHLSGWMGSAVGAEALVQWLWWTAQWPILLLGLLLAFATILYLGPDVDHPRWSFLTVGTVFAVVVWLAASAAFALFTSRFGSYDKTWGSLAIVIIMLTWLWLSSLALLLGAEVNAEAERSRELRRGDPAETTLTAPPKG
jgi:membrane protein